MPKSHPDRLLGGEVIAVFPSKFLTFTNPFKTYYLTKEYLIERSGAFFKKDKVFKLYMMLPEKIDTNVLRKSLLNQGDVSFALLRGSRDGVTEESRFVLYNVSDPEGVLDTVIRAIDADRNDKKMVAGEIL